jgi:predicted amidohydrolase YtcJ
MAPTLGVLRPGALADMIVVDSESWDAAPPAIGAPFVRMTIMSGQVVWQGGFAEGSDDATPSG